MARSHSFPQMVLDQMTTHLVLPRFLPFDESSESPYELMLISLMVDTLKFIDNTYSIPATTLKLFHNFKVMHPLADAKLISHLLNSMQTGDMLGMYVRMQNCGLMIYKLPIASKSQLHNLIFSTFPAKFPASEIYKCSSDLQFQYPSQSLKVKSSKMLESIDFANQLCILYNTEIIFENERMTNYLSKWLLTSLCDRHSVMATEQESPHFAKKVRDDVIGIFQRSCYWSVIKVLLQSNLTIEFGQARGRFLYKLIVLGFLTKICNFYNDQPLVNVELVNQLLAKIARRIEKIDKKFDSQSENKLSCATLYVEFSLLITVILGNAKNVIAQVRSKINLQIKELQNVDEHNSMLRPLSNLNFKTDVVQQIPTLRDYLKKRHIKVVQSAYDGHIRYTKVTRHYMNNKIFPSSDSLVANDLTLIDAENWILYELKYPDGIKIDSTELRQWSVQYASIAEQLYEEDPIANSKMLLTRFKILTILDMIATKKYPLLLQHRIGINSNIFDNLILPQHIDMEICNSMQKYCRQRDSKASRPSLIEEDKPQMRSFSVRFAQTNSEMQEIHCQIQRLADREIAEKKAEWQKERDRVAEMRRKESKMSCSYYTTTYGRLRHRGGCAKCLLAAQINDVKITLYERPLPTDEHEQYAVVFELAIPIEIASLRDVLCANAKLLANGSQESIGIYEKWIRYNRISAHNRSNCQLVSMGSSSKLTLSRQNQVTSLHVDSPFDSFIVENGYNCYYYADHENSYNCYHYTYHQYLPTKISNQSVKHLCTFSVENHSPYANLQWMLESTSHTQNEVLATQNNCSILLLLKEYKNFGSLRADGNRLQLRKLYAMIETESISFETSSVLSLIMQTIWETGPIGNCQYKRESHEDFTDPIFSMEMVKLLEKFIEQQKCNWKDPKKQLMATLVITRIFDLNCDETVVNRIVEVLRNVRTIIIDWMEKIQKAIQECNDQSNETALRLILLDVVIVGAATFFVHSKHKFFSYIFANNSDDKFSALRMWLDLIVTMNNNILLMTSSETNVRRVFVRFVRYIGIHLELTIGKLIENNPNEVKKLVKGKWAKAKDGKFAQPYFCTDQPETLIVKVTIDGNINNVLIDTVTGEFTVNSLPVNKLPSSVIQTNEFQRVFRGFVFEIQPVKENCFTTVHKYKGCSYDFNININNIVITERRKDGTKCELIPTNILSNEIPYLLIQNHSHWWNKSENIIEFRPKHFTDKQFSLPSSITYKLDLNTQQLLDLKTKSVLLDVTSFSYNEIIKRLSRLECKEYIHILISPNVPDIAKVELQRMHLKFEIDTTKRSNEYDIVSNEFSGMRASLQQKCGTLFGLNNGLLLESYLDTSNSTPKMLLIIPHGDINVSKSGYHVNVGINGCLRSPPFHTYRIDDFCRQLTASSCNYSAWFYLAYLHALTSHGEPEPFTGLSGLERSLQILQSAFVWSSAPFDKEAYDTLKAIAGLSPVRKYRGNREENGKFIEWPKTIHPHAANDAYIFIVIKLLTDSQRLRGLYTQTDRQEIESKTQLTLNKREYIRCLTLSPNVRVSNQFVPFEMSLTTQTIFNEPEPFVKQTRIVSLLHHERQYHVTHDLNLKSFLIGGRSELDGPIHIDIAEQFLNHGCAIDFGNLWISFYEIARRRLFHHEKFALICSLFAHQGLPLGLILALQTVEANAVVFNSIPAPAIGGYNLVFLNFSADEITKIWRQHHNNPSDYSEYTSDMQSKYDSQVTTNICNLTTAVKRMWPCDAVNSTIFNHSAKDISIHKAVVEIDKFLFNWNNNRKLQKFIDQVQTKLESLRPGNCDITNLKCWSIKRSVQLDWNKYEIDFEAKLSEDLHQYSNEIAEAEAVYKINNINASQTVRTAQQWFEWFLKITHSPNTKHLIDARMYPRLVITLVLKRLLSSTDYRLKWIIGAFAVTLSHEQRKQRIATFEQQPQMVVALEREKENELHSNWLPSQYSEWLLFEIEQNLSIRRIQIEIAKRMINPPTIRTHHAVMQLNMGEGKTSVIVPILASVLSDTKKVCQITVLKSLYATNLKSLRQCLGGMLNQRVYTFPCRRDMPIGNYVADMLRIYEECKQNKGVILTLPEYRLSFQLKIYESISKGQLGEAEHFLFIHNWLNANVRSILDESDAILDAKYQLIYTIGDQMALDGGTARWVVNQALFKRVPHHMKMLYKKHGNEKIELNEDYLTNNQLYGADKVLYRSDVFTPCRILDEQIYIELKEALVNDFVDGKIDVTFSEIVRTSEKHLKRLLQDKNIDKKSFEELIEKFPEDKHFMLLILGGLLRFEVLRLVMMKRWRVNYGVNEKSTRKMAIPFKAKDVAAEMTEFGHPDVALCFTHLSHYYSGLTDEQLYHVFKILSTNQNPDEIYEQWIQSVSPELVDVSIKSYTGVNLKDPKQRDEYLFPLLRFNMHVIDYWLCNAVFPREAKTFQSKLICTAWDLCSEEMQHTVSGFSGTNDTKNLLPSTISQNDLEELEQTNENVRLTLLRDDNQGYKSLPANISGLMILTKLAECEIPVLLDAGALMLELNNKQVATEWLKLVPRKSFDAAIYFNVNNVMMTIDRNDIMAEFDCSVYREKLNRCLVYLDDAHTRGTDLKFPLNWRACVTLSGDITRDKTVQACMRMRMLGKGHCIAFWASFEASIRIREICDLDAEENITNKHVVDFICHNSQRFEEENTVHWAAAGCNYTKKLSAHKLYENSADAKKALAQLNSNCLDNEFLTLKEMYGGKDVVLFSKMSADAFNQLIKIYRGNPSIGRFIEKIKKTVYEKIMAHIPDVTRFTGFLDEEQEKELEQELEEQRQIERPPQATPAIPSIDPLLFELIRFGGSHSSYQKLIQSKSLLTLPLSLKNAKIFDLVKTELSAWSEHLYATIDFVHVINETMFLWDKYLRPIWWIACVQRNSKTNIILVLSSFECNGLLPYFRNSKNAVLYMFRPRISLLQSNLLHNNQLQVTSMTNVPTINMCDEVQISMIAGSMYFGSELEQNAYCCFMGLIPRQRTKVHQRAFANGLIQPNGFVPLAYRQFPDIVDAVGQCKFVENPVAIATEIIEACHEFLRKNSHVDSILNGKKQIIKTNEN